MDLLENVLWLIWNHHEKKWHLPGIPSWHYGDQVAFWGWTRLLSRWQRYEIHRGWRHACFRDGTRGEEVDWGRQEAGSHWAGLSWSRIIWRHGMETVSALIVIFVWNPRALCIQNCYGMGHSPWCELFCDNQLQNAPKFVFPYFYRQTRGADLWVSFMYIWGCVLQSTDFSHRKASDFSHLTLTTVLGVIPYKKTIRKTNSHIVLYSILSCSHPVCHGGATGGANWRTANWVLVDIFCFGTVLICLRNHSSSSQCRPTSYSSV